MTKRRGDWMITVSGRRFYPLDPRPDDLDWNDVGHHLSRLCRYGGAVEDWYTVAEHSALMCDHFLAIGDPDAARYAIVHDGPEAYIGDLIRPIKPDIPAFRDIEAPIEIMMLDMLGLPPELPTVIKIADALIIGDERQQLFRADILARARWVVDGTLGVTCRRWDRDQARQEWLIRFRALFPGVT